MQKKIVIVEDEKYILDIYVEIMTSAGFAVQASSSAAEGLNAIEASKPDLVMLDLMMPGVDGMEVLKVVRKNPDKYGSPIIVVLTNLSNELMIKNAFSENADGYLMKAELTPEQVVSEIKGFLHID